MSGLTTVVPQHAGISAFARQRKADSRERLLLAAVALFNEHGYSEVTVEHILARAGISRPTFYRHFSNKIALAVQLYGLLVSEGESRRLAIRDANWRDPVTVSNWIKSIFDADLAERRLNRAFSQAVIDSEHLALLARETIVTMIEGLGKRIPSFVLEESAPVDRRRWLQAYLVLFEILDQSSHAALGSGVATDPQVIDLLTERFLAFVNLSGETGPPTSA